MSSMQNPRRVARELALKVLFQVDVGKQPLGEVLDGALDQVRITVDGPVSQIVQDAQHSLRDLAARRSQELATQMSVQSTRLVKQTAQGMINELRALADTAKEQTRATVATPGPDAAERAEAGLREALEGATRPALLRVATRESHYP